MNKQGCILSKDQGLSVDRKIKRDTAANSQTALQHPKASQEEESVADVIVLPDHKVQCVSVKSVTPWMYDM